MEICGLFWNRREGGGKGLFASPEKLRKGIVVIFLMEIQTPLITVCDRLLEDLGLAPKPWLICCLPLQAGERELGTGDNPRSVNRSNLPEAGILHIRRKNKVPQQVPKRMACRGQLTLRRQTCTIQLCKKQLVKMTARGPEHMKERGNGKNVIDPPGVYGERSMTSMVKLYSAALLWSKKSAAWGREEGNDEYLDSHECLWE